jgi:hypothetical protein
LIPRKILSEDLNFPLRTKKKKKGFHSVKSHLQIQHNEPKPEADIIGNQIASLLI